MSRPEGISEAELSRMKERLAQIEEQVRSTRLEFSDGITVRNSTGRGLQLTLNISERHHPTSDAVPDAEELTLNSTFKLPNNSAVSHQFTRNGKGYFNPNYCSTNHHTSASRELHSSPTRTSQMEQKFQSTGSKKRIFDSLEQTIDPKIKKGSNNRIKIEEEDVSDIEQEQKVRPFTGDEPKERAQSQHGLSFQTFGDIHIPRNQSNNSHGRSSKKTESLQPSPQVYSYLHQQYRSHQPELNTSFKKLSQLRLSNGAQVITPLKSQPKQLPNSHSKLSDIQATSKKTSEIKQSPSKQHNSIHPITHQNKASINQKEKWIVVRSQHLRSKSKSKLQVQTKQKKKSKAEQLYKQRKTIFPAKKSTLRDQLKHKKDVEKRFNRFVTASKAANDHSLSKLSLSPKIEAITDRLSTRQRSPCGHYRLFSESKERQSFYRLVDQNPIASKYMCKEQREALFQQLRNDPDSVSLWPMKIVNYTYAKLKKSCSVNYSVLKE